MSLVIVSRSRHMQYIFYLNIVKRQLHLLYEELKRIDEYSRYNRTKLERTLQDSYDRFLCHRLYLAREIYSLIYEIASEINDAFGWSHLANLAHAFVQISVDCYWLYWNIYNNVITELFFFDKGTGIIPSIVIVYLVFGYTTGLHAMVNSSNDKMFKSKAPDKYLTKNLAHFSVFLV
ncbi:hypothetical protein HA402_005859 [Bradysia odoriphaga]|nr:hypothetical protein HA402_005859 [Bradysia odoriphaga]